MLEGYDRSPEASSRETQPVRILRSVEIAGVGNMIDRRQVMPPKLDEGGWYYKYNLFGFALGILDDGRRREECVENRTLPLCYSNYLGVDIYHELGHKRESIE